MSEELPPSPAVPEAPPPPPKPRRRINWRGLLRSLFVRSYALGILLVVGWAGYTAFNYLRMGYASALAWVQLLIILALTALAFWSARKWVHYV